MKKIIAVILAAALILTSGLQVFAEEPEEFTVTFDANGGEVSPGSAETIDKMLVSLPTPTRSGFTFKGWKHPGGSMVTAGSTTFMEDTTITAQWESEVASFTITLNSNGGSINQTLQTGTDGRLLNLPTPTRAGFTFTGWFTAIMGGESVTITRVYSGDETIYAQWTSVQSTFTVTFNANLGTVSPANAMTGTDGRLPSLPIPMRQGFTFVDWYTAAGARVTAATVYTADTTIFAGWVQQGVIPPDPNGGNGAPPPDPNGGNGTPPPDPNGTNGVSPPDPNGGNGDNGNPPPPPPPIEGTINDNLVFDALEQLNPRLTLSVAMGSVISPTALGFIKDSGKIIEIVLPNGITLRLDGKKITGNPNPVDLNIIMTITARENQPPAEGIPEKSIIIKPAAQGRFGFEVSFNIEAGDLAAAGLDVSEMSLFRIKNDNSVEDMGKISRNNDGTVTIVLREASYFILSVEVPAPGNPPETVSGGNAGTIILVVIIVLMFAGAGAAAPFVYRNLRIKKIYRY